MIRKPMSQAPLISIITVCYNSERYIEETIRSVINQTYGAIEYIVVDGASEDNTIKIIQKYTDKIAKFVSEPDKGMYEAINKGLQMCTGDYILILNSDDVLNNTDTITEVVNKMYPEHLDYYYGNIVKVMGDQSRLVRLFNVNYKWLLYSTHSTFVPHPCLFVSAGLNHKLGGYNTKYKYASDYDYILRALITSHNKGKHLNLPVTRFRVHDQSISASGKITPERLKVLEEHGYFKIPAFIRRISYISIWIFYKMINTGNGYRA